MFLRILEDWRHYHNCLKYDVNRRIMSRTFMVISHSLMSKWAHELLSKTALGTDFGDRCRIVRHEWVHCSSTWIGVFTRTAVGQCSVDPEQNAVRRAGFALFLEMECPARTQRMREFGDAGGIRGSFVFSFLNDLFLHPVTASGIRYSGLSVKAVGNINPHLREKDCLCASIDVVKNSWNILGKWTHEEARRTNWVVQSFWRNRWRGDCCVSGGSGSARRPANTAILGTVLEVFSGEICASVNTPLSGFVFSDHVLYEVLLIALIEKIVYIFGHERSRRILDWADHQCPTFFRPQHGWGEACAISIFCTNSDRILAQDQKRMDAWFPLSVRTHYTETPSQKGLCGKHCQVRRLCWVWRCLTMN